jgi:hypothetical protein
MSQQQPATYQYGAPVQQQPGYTPPSTQYPVGAPVQSQKKPISKRMIIIPIVIAAAIVSIVVFVVALNVLSGADEPDYFTLGGEKVPSVSLALGEERKLQSTDNSTKNGIQTLTAVYAVSGSAQGADMRDYLRYLCNNEGFALRSNVGDSAFDGPNGSSVQVWRNARESGFMLVVQVDWDSAGYSVTFMRGEGQVEGGTTGGLGTDTGGTDTDETDIDETDTGGSGSETGANGTDTGGQLPAGEPSSTSTINDLKIATYDDGTVSIEDGTIIIAPNGQAYYQGAKRTNEAPISIPENGSSMAINGGSVKIVNGEFYISANGTLVYIDANGDVTYHDLK